MARLYANENFPRLVVDALRANGHDVLTLMEAGNAWQVVPDEQVVALATENARVVLSLNRRDFVEWHAQRPSHAGCDLLQASDGEPISVLNRFMGEDW